MRQFKDENGKPWTLCVNIGTVKAVKSLAKVDLLDLKDGSLFNDLASDPVKLGDVLWVLCQEEAKSAGITEMQFAAALAGDALEAATNALLEEIVDFFPRPQREVLRKALAKGRDMQEKQLAKALKQLEETIDSWEPAEPTVSGG